SDQSMGRPIYFREGDFCTEQRNQQERSESEILSGQSSPESSNRPGLHIQFA
ncbi:hypothetical protein J4Q44_G00393520, partial [Coregonus suidteri]